MTRSQRSNLIQWAVFVAGLALVALVLGVTVRWGDLADRFFKWEDFTDQFPGIVTEAARNTLVYTAIGYLGGLVIGLVVALMRQSQVPPARVIASVYIEVFRALPALLTILIVGFQADHTLGRRIVERRNVLKIFGEEVPLAAEVEVLNGYSAHGDRTELARWLDAVRAHGAADGRRDPQVYLVHGEPDAQEAFASQLRNKGFRVAIPSPGDRVGIA